MTLSVVNDGGIAVVIATPFFVTSQNRTEVTFEVFERDAASLKALVGKPQYYVLDGSPFWAQLRSLEPCESTHPGLALLRDKATLRGVLRVIEEPTQSQS